MTTRAPPTNRLKQFFLKFLSRDSLEHDIKNGGLFAKVIRSRLSSKLTGQVLLTTEAKQKYH